MRKYIRVAIISIIISIALTSIVFANENERIKLTPFINLTGHSSGIYHMEFNSSGDKLISCSYNGDLFLWNIETGIGSRIDDYSGLRGSSIFSKNGNYLISSGEYGYIIGDVVNIHDPNTGKLVDSIELYADEGSHSPYIDKKNLPATALGITPDSKTLIIGCDEHRFNPYSSIRYYDIDLKKEVFKFNVNGVVRTIENHPNKDIFAYITSDVSSDGYIAITIRDRETAKILMNVTDSLKLSTHTRYDLKFSPNGKYLAAVSYQNTEAQLVIFDIEDSYKQAHSDIIYGKATPMNGKLSFSSDGKLLIVGNKLYSIEDEIKEIQGEISGGTYGKNSIGVLSPDDKYIAITSGSDIIVYKSEIINKVESQIKLIANGTDSTVHLRWEPVEDTQNLIGYYLYRSNQSGKYDSLTVTDFPILETSYTDKNVNKNETYFYIVKAIYTDNSQSQPSNEIKVTLQNRSQNITIELQVNNPIMNVNGQEFEIDPGRGTTPLILNGRTVIPIRAFIEAMNGTVIWNQEEEKISITVEEKSIELWLNKKNIVVNSEAKEMDIAPQVIQGRTMVPVRFIAENLGFHINWDAAAQKAVMSR